MDTAGDDAGLGRMIGVRSMADLTGKGTAGAWCSSDLFFLFVRLFTRLLMGGVLVLLYHKVMQRCSIIVTFAV